MANFSTTNPVPGITTAYTQVLSEINSKFTDLIQGLDPDAATNVTNVPTGAIRWAGASNKWQKWSGNTWADLTALYGINISGNAATATELANARAINGINFNGSTDITITANTTQALTFNNGGVGSLSGTTFNGSTARTISYNTVGAPSSTGVNASGTWAISITGNAATANNATFTAKSGTLSAGGGSGGTAMTFNWSGQGGQPSWLWGGNDGSSMFVYNPSNFSVNYANSAGSVNSVSTAQVLNATAGATSGVVGSYMIVYTSTDVWGANTTRPGSNFGQSGTWRVINATPSGQLYQVSYYGGGYATVYMALVLRIS
jgi:hypothetical protein